MFLPIVYSETKKFAKAYNIRAICAYGGGNKWEQQKDLEAGAEIVIATPGRLIDLVKCKSTNLNRVTMLVLDEAGKFLICLSFFFVLVLIHFFLFLPFFQR